MLSAVRPPIKTPAATSVNAGANESPRAAPSSSSPSSLNPPYKIPKFLRSLYAILQKEDSRVISWVQNQELRPNRVTAFHILDMDRFEKDVLPKYFKHSKFASFQRQLNNFGFRKWTKTQSSGVCTFSHNSFPPDPKRMGVLRASIREQWRPKNPDSRRRVGNGVSKAERQLQEQVQKEQQRRQQLEQAQRRAAEAAKSKSSPMHSESFCDMLKSPMSTDACEMAGFSLSCSAQDMRSSKMLRPMASEWPSAAATYETVFPTGTPKLSLLPSLNHQLAPSPMHMSNNTINIGMCPHPMQPQQYQMVGAMKPEMVDNATGNMHGVAAQQQAMDPWMWEPHSMPPSLEASPYCLDMSWSIVNAARATDRADFAMGHPANEHCPPGTPMDEFMYENLLMFAE